MLSNIFPRRNPTGSGIFEEPDIASFRNRLEHSLFSSQRDWSPRKSRQECLDRAQSAFREGNSTAWVRSALDITTHTLFCTERSSDRPQLASNLVRNLLHITDFKHWSQLCEFLAEEYDDNVAELKLLLITGSLVEVECLVSREIDDLIGPYRATQDIESWIRYNIARKPRGFDIESVKKLAAQYNNTDGTPINELVELGLSNVINLHSNDDICNEYERIFVDRRSVPTGAVRGIPIFALSYKHECRDLRMSRESFIEVCRALKGQGFGKVQLWIDAVLKHSTDTWARRGLLPYTVLPVVIHNNEFYDRGKERIWLKLERVASSGRSGILYTRPTKSDHVSMDHGVTGDARDLVAGCILVQDYDPESVTYESDEIDLKEWATEHFTVATFRSFLGISRMGRGRVAEEMKQECLYSAALTYNDTMPHREVQYVADYRPSFPDNGMDCGYREIRNRAFARNERLMTFLCRFNGTRYRVRASHGLGIAVFRMGAVGDSSGTDHVGRVNKTSRNERQDILHAVTDGLIRLSEQSEDKVSQLTSGESLNEDARKRNATVTFDEWNHWPQIYTAAEMKKNWFAKFVRVCKERQ